MGSKTLRTCFISAPVGVDITPLREALAERGVEAWDSSAVLTGSTVPRMIQDAIEDADFLCAVIPAGPVASNVYYEVGVAAGKDLPRLLFVAPKADLPAALREQPYARTTLDNASALRFHLDAFLKNAGKHEWKRASGQSDERASRDATAIDIALDRLITWGEAQGWQQEQTLVNLLADVLEASGYITSMAPVPTDQSGVRPDMAVWIDELQTTVGNPVLIEVVAKHSLVPAAIRELQLMLSGFQSTLGLVIFWGHEAAEPPRNWAQPFITAMHVREFAEVIRKGDFARALLVRRNALVHSAA